MGSAIGAKGEKMVAIKKIEMPKNCEECQFSEPYKNREGERIVLCELECEVETLGKAITRNSHCPLIEIPDDALLVIPPRGNGKSRTTLWQALSQCGFSGEEILEMFINIEMPERREE